MPNTSDSKKYISLTRLGNFLDKLKTLFAESNHKHKLSDIEDYVVDSELSPLSNNPVQNNVIDAEFETVATAMAALEAHVDTKADEEHSHDDKYYPIEEVNSKLLEKADKEHLHSIEDVTSLQELLDEKVPEIRTINGKTLEENITLSPEDIGAANAEHDHNNIYHTKTEVDERFNVVNTSISNIEDGTTVVAKANHAVNSDNATYAMDAKKAAQDGDGNVIKDTYETKSEATSKLTEAKGYADAIKNDLLNGAGEAYDTLKELGDLINDNTNAIDALNKVAAGKADKEHAHDDAYYKKEEIDNMELITIEDIDSICGSTITAATLSEVTF